MCKTDFANVTEKEMREVSDKSEDNDKSYCTDLYLAQPELDLRDVAFMANGGIGA